MPSLHIARRVENGASCNKSDSQNADRVHREAETVPAHYGTSAADNGLREWLRDRLQEERSDVLSHLESSHRRLLGQMLEFSGESTAASKTSRDRTHAVEDKVTPTPPLSPKTEKSSEVAWVARPEAAESKCEENGENTAEYRRDYSSASIHAVWTETGKHDEDEHRESETSGRASGRNSYFSKSFPVATGFEASSHGQVFEWFFASMIALNTCVMAMNQQYNGLQIGYILQYRTYDTSGKESWPGGEMAFDVLEKMFTVIFTIEFFLRLIIYKMTFLKDRWCYFDGIIVTIGWLIFFKKEALDFNPTFVRLARLSKLLRLVRLLRSQEIFDSLKLLVAAIYASYVTLFWSLFILIIIQCVTALFMVQSLEGFLEDAEKHVEVRRVVFGYFGTFWRAMITLFEITFANWATSCRVLVDGVDEAYGILYLIYRCVIGFAVLMVVQAVFIQQTMKTTQLDDEYLAQQQARTKAKMIRRLETIFRRLDTSGDGYLGREELEPGIKFNYLMKMLEVFDLEVADVDVLFSLLDHGDGKISIDGFVNGVEHLKGAARAIDLLEVKQDIKQMKKHMAGGRFSAKRRSFSSLSVK